MTTLATEDVECELCGHSHEILVVMSTYIGGPPDLDTRPAMLARANLPHDVIRCPGCGYCRPAGWNPATEQLDALRTMLRSEDYRRQLADSSRPALASEFLAAAKITEVAGDLSIAGWVALKAAWACDDEQAVSEARACRAHAVELWTRAGSDSQSFAADEGTRLAIIADTRRRAADFDGAREAAAIGLGVADDETVLAVLAVVDQLAQAGDDGPYTVAAALGDVP